jgi:hypothetical protein
MILLSNKAKRPWARRFVFIIKGGNFMQENLLSYQQLVSVIASADVNVAHCAALGLAIDLYIIDHGKLEDDDKVADILNTFTQTSEIVYHDSYQFGRSDTVDTVEQKLLNLFQALRRHNFCATEIFEDDEYIGFKDHFGAVIKARKV